MRKRTWSLLLGFILTLALLSTAALAVTTSEASARGRSAARAGSATQSETSVAKLERQGENPQYFDTFSDAYKEAGNGDTIALLANTETDLSSVGKALTIQLGSYTLSSTRSAMEIYNTVTICGPGKICNLTVEVRGSLTLNDGVEVAVVIVHTGNYNYGDTMELTINDATITEKLQIPVSDVETVNMALKGGTYKKIEASWQPVSPSDALPEGYAFVDENGEVLTRYDWPDGKFLVVAHTHQFENDCYCACGVRCKHDTILDDGTCDACKKLMAARVTNGSTVTYCETIYDVEKVSSGSTVTLLADASDTYDQLVLSENVTFALNNHTLNSLIYSGIGTLQGAGTVSYINVEGNGVLTITGDVQSQQAIASYGGTLYIQNGTYQEVYLQDANSTVKMSGGIYNNWIHCDDNCLISDMLADGYAFAEVGKTTATDFRWYRTNWERDDAGYSVTVISHPTHDYTSGTEGACACGAECSHKAIKEDATCQSCGMTMLVHLQSTARYYQFSNWAYEAAAENDILTFYRDDDDFNGYLCPPIQKNLTIALNSKMIGNVWAITLQSDVTMKGPGTANKLAVGNGTEGKLTLTENANVTELTVKDKGTLIADSSSGVVDTLTVESGYTSVQLSGGTYGTIKSNVANTSVWDFLVAGYGYQTTDASAAWIYSDDTPNCVELHNVKVKELPIKSATIKVSNENIDPFSSSTITVEKINDVSAAQATGVTYQWYQKVDGQWKKLDGKISSSYEVANLSCGTYEYKCAITKEGYSLSKECSITVSPLDITGITAPKAKDGLIYTGDKQALITEVTGQPTGCTPKYSTDGENWSVEIPTGKDAKCYDVYWKIEGNDNYNDYIPSPNTPIRVTIQRMPISAEGENAGTIEIDPENKTDLTYNGSAKEPEIVIKDKDGNVVPKEEYDVEYKNNVDAGTGTITIKDKDSGNYTIAETVKEFTITQKAITIAGVTATDRKYKRDNLTVELTGGELVGVVAEDDVSFTLGEGTMADDKVGKDKPVTTNITLNGDDAKNYAITQPTVTVNIKKAPSNKPVEEPGEEPEDKTPFEDVPEDSYFKDAVDWAVKNEITKGLEDNLFGPDGVCTRAQAVTFLWRAAGCPAPQSGDMPFVDVPEDIWYYDAVLWATENNITLGTDATTFSPELNCSRAHIVTFQWRAAGMPTETADNPFTDVESDAYYMEAVLWAVKQNITNGMTATTFRPDDDCTRAQIVTFIYRAQNQ